MSTDKSDTSSDNLFVTASSDSENDPEKLVYSVKNGISLNDIQTSEGAVFDLDPDRDLTDFAYKAQSEYFTDDCSFDNLLRDSDSESDTDSSNDDQELFQKLKEKMVALTSDGGVMKRIKKQGFGSPPPEKSKVVIHYNAYLELLDEPFDSTRLRNRPMEFILDDGEVLRGLNIGVSTMRQNEVAEILISPEYGLGAMGCPPRIPANATILYMVELLRIVDLKAAIEFSRMNADDRKVASFTKVLEACKARNRLANDYFSKKMYPRAVKEYSRTVHTLSDVNLANEEEERQHQSLLSKVYSNLSQCHLNMNAPDRAIPCAIKALQSDPKNNKALFRCGKACRLNAEYDKSRHYLERAARKEPSNLEIIKELQLLERDIKKFHDFERQFCANIFKENARPTNTPTKPLTTSNEFAVETENYLTKFKEEGQDEFLPFTAGFSDSDIEVVKKVADRLGLHYVAPRCVDAKLRVYRNKPQ